MKAEIIAVGSELLTPYRLDTNSLYLTGELNRLGIRVIHKAVVGDSPDEMRTSFRHALNRSELSSVVADSVPPMMTAREKPSRICWAANCTAMRKFCAAFKNAFAVLHAPCRK
jgi:hypothetical protein